jgi:DNA-binding transcriptional LysR family regulator
MTMEARHLRGFIAVADHLNFTRAAAELGLPQPALSSQIKRLEELLGLLLFQRTTRSVALTPDGEALLPVARRAAAALDALSTAGSATSRLPLRLATEAFMPALLEIAAARSTLELDYTVMEQPTSLGQLADGQLDAFVGWDYPVVPADLPVGVRREVVAVERLCAYLPLRHPAARRESIALAELSGAEWVVRPRGTRHHQALVASALGVGFEPVIRCFSGDSHTAATLLVDGSAISYGGPMSRPGLGFALVPFSDPFDHETVLLTHEARVGESRRRELSDVVHGWRDTIVARRLEDPATTDAVRASLRARPRSARLEPDPVGSAVGADRRPSTRGAS